MQSHADFGVAPEPANARAVAYLELRIGARTLFGVGMDSNIVSASFKAIVSGLGRTRSGSKSESVLGTAPK